MCKKGFLKNKQPLEKDPSINFTQPVQLSKELAHVSWNTLLKGLVVISAFMSTMSRAEVPVNWLKSWSTYYSAVSL